MSERKGPCKKTPKERLSDLFEGESDARQRGDKAARRYLERVLEMNDSLPRSVRFFAEALLLSTGDEDALGRAAPLLAEAREALPRELSTFLDERKDLVSALVYEPELPEADREFLEERQRGARGRRP